MAITNFQFPGTTLTQVFEAAGTGSISTLGVACVGQQFKLHRSDVLAEAAKIDQSDTAYSVTAGLTVSTLPGRDAASTLDTDTTKQKLVVKEGQFAYYTANASNINPEIVADATNYIVFDSAVKDGLGYTAVAGFGTRGARVGDTVVISTTDASIITEISAIVGVPGVGYAKIQVADLGNFDSEDTISVAFCAVVDAIFEQGVDTFSISSAGALTIQGGLEASIPELSGITGTLQKGDFYIEYRERAFNYVGSLGTVASLSDIEELVGGISADNPLAVALYCALAASSSVVYFTGVASEDAQGYAEALDFLDKYVAIYSIVPATEDSDIIQACSAAVLSISEDPESKVRRSLWYGISGSDELLLSTAVADTAVGTVTFDSNVFLNTPYKAGDVLETTTGVRYVITATDGLKEATVTGTPALAVATDVTFKYIRTAPARADRVKDLISKRVVSSYRAQCVWADGLLLNGEYVGAYAGAAAAAGMRAGEPVHRPISNLSYSFFSLAEPNGFTNTQLKELGSNGIWIIANNDSGVPINKKQVTSAMANNINLDEESVVSNADAISLDLSNVGVTYVGNTNISDTLLYRLTDDISNIMDAKTTTISNTDLVGAQLIDWSLDSLFRDSNNLDWVYASLSCQPPKPFNRFNLTVRIV